MIATTDITVHRLGPQDVTDAMRLQAEISTSTPAGYVRAKSPDDLEAIFAGIRGAAHGVRDEDGALIAMGLLMTIEALPPGAPAFPRVPLEDWPGRCAFMENTMVLPHARGRGYQRQLLDARIAEAATRGTRWLCSGVHLANQVSWSNLMAHGFAAVGMRMDFGYPVFGLLRRADGPLAVDARDQFAIRIDDTAAAHGSALNAEYAGIRRDGARIIYARLREPGRSGPVVIA
jgi:GNAT superfamily N-acetyltransferase